MVKPALYFGQPVFSFKKALAFQIADFMKCFFHPLMRKWGFYENFSGYACLVLLHHDIVSL